MAKPRIFFSLILGGYIALVAITFALGQMMRIDPRESFWGVPCMLATLPWSLVLTLGLLPMPHAHNPACLNLVLLVSALINVAILFVIFRKRTRPNP